MLAVGFLANWLVKAVAPRFHMTEEKETGIDGRGGSRGRAAPAGFSAVVLLAWAAICIPIAWGVYETLIKAAVLLR